MSARASGALLGAALLLVGCGGARLAEKSQAGSEPEASDERAPARDQAEPAQPPLAPADPWGRVPGGPAGQTTAAATTVAFRAPQAPRPLPDARRPRLGGGQVLAVVRVRDGLITGEGELLLRLDHELSRVEELDAVVGPGAEPSGDAMGLEELAALAAAHERQLLLVDVIPSRTPGALRDGYLVHTVTGELLATWSVDPERPPVVPTGQRADLVQRIVAAHARLGDEG